MKSLNLVELSKSFGAMKRCEKDSNWYNKHEEKIEELCELLPRGSGFDSGTKFDRERSTPEKLIFRTTFHHIDESGRYHGYTDHSIIITPSFEHSYDIRVTGTDQRHIKNHILQVFMDLITIDYGK